MSSRAWHARVRDILDAIAEIRAFTENMDFERFQRDLKTVRAVEMNLVVIGEAANSIPDDVQEAHPEIPWQLIRGMRNRLIHAYFAFDDSILWETAKTDIPNLEALLPEMSETDID